jgi:hypothetical protein
MRRHRLAICVAAVAIAALAPATASAWAPADQAAVHPGVMTFTDGAQCTSNFVFTDGSSTYLGQAAHCSGTGTAAETNGCDSGSLPVGTPVETHPDTCDYNDFALVRIDPADVDKVNPSVPGFGGPTGIGGAGEGATVYSYGNSSLRGGVTKLSPKEGRVVATDGGGWSRTVYTVTPGVPGDSGSGFLNGSGAAIGVLSTLQILPTAGSNGVGDLARELNYMRANSSFSGVQLEPGTEAFDGDLVNAIGGA